MKEIMKTLDKFTDKIFAYKPKKKKKEKKPILVEKKEVEKGKY